MQLHTRAGIECLGKYLSRVNQRRVDEAIAKLSQAVTTVARDYRMEDALDDLATGLIPERDNRSITEDEWVEKAIATYGCPVHATSGNDGSDEFTVSGYGPCSCRRRSKVQGTSAGRRRGDHNDQQGHQEVQSVNGTGRRSVRPVLNDTGEHPRRTAPSPAGIPSQSRAVVRARSYSSESYEAALRSTYHTAGRAQRGHNPLSVDEVVASHLHGSSYAGAPLFRSNRDVLDEGKRLANSIISGKRGFDPYVFGRRVSDGLSGPKTRLVWMAPLPTTIVGTRFSKPVMADLSRTRPFVWGTHGIERGAIIASLESRFRYTYSIDFSKFDSTVPAHMIDDAFRVARTHLELDAQDAEVWVKYVNDFIHSRIIAPDGNIYQKHKGVPSGSAFTSIIDSIVNLILVSYMWHRVTGHELPHDRLLVMGDDVTVGSNTYIPKSRLAAVAAELGFALSVEKTTIRDTSDDSQDFEKRTHFLGYYHMNSQPHRPMKKLVRQMVFPERHRKRKPHEWIVRLLGYAMTSREGFLVLQTVFRHEDSIQAYLLAASRAKELGWSDEDDIPDADLPGQLRYRRRVEGETIEIRPSKVTGGVFGRWT